MPRTKVILCRDDDGRVPVLEWLDSIPDKARDKCRIRMERLREVGHELRRPEADYLRDGIYELRIGLHGINYRILYFFHGTIAVVLSHGLIKGRDVPATEIAEAVARKHRFNSDPERHTYEYS